MKERFSTVDGIRIETTSFYGETRFRFWAPSFWFKGYGVSDGGMYKTIREAVVAGKEFAKESN